MVVGNGLIASVFEKKYSNSYDVIIFASGVSNSKEIKKSEFEREINLIKKYINKNKLFVYFSTTSVYDEHLKGNPYITHKLNAEELIKENCSNYLIIRASNLVGAKGNKTNVLNYFYNKVISNETFNLWIKAKRNLLDIDDFYEITNEIIKSDSINKTYNVCNLKSEPVLNLIEEIEKHSNIKANYIVENLGGEVKVNTDRIKPFISLKLQNKITSKKYLSFLLKKYFS